MFNPESAYGDYGKKLWFKRVGVQRARPWDYFGKPDRGKIPTASGRPCFSAKNFKTPTLVIHSQLDLQARCERGVPVVRTPCSGLKVPSKDALLFRTRGHWVLEAAELANSGIRTVNEWVG